jgi:ribosome-binding factor A
LVSHRPERVASTIQRALQEALSRGLADPRATGLITITRVEIPPDLKTASVWFSVYPEDRQQLVLHALKHAASHLRHRISDAIALRQTPELHFKLDLSAKREAAVLRALAENAGENAVSLPHTPESDRDDHSGSKARNRNTNTDRNSNDDTEHTA